MIEVVRISTYRTINLISSPIKVLDMCLMRKVPVNNIIEVAIAGLWGIAVVECLPNTNYTLKLEKNYQLALNVTSVAVVEEGKSLIFSQCQIRDLYVLDVQTGSILFRILNSQESLSYNPGGHSIHPIFSDANTLTTKLFLVRNSYALYLVDLASENDSTHCNLKKKKKQSLIH
jgi:hypothetical protein